MKLQAVIAAAGTGTRLGMEEPKPFIALNGRPMVCYALQMMQGCRQIASVIVTAEPAMRQRMTDLIGQYGFDKVRHVVAGGATRSASVKNALAVLDADTDWVLIHDGARPLLRESFLERMILAAPGAGALIAAVPVAPTIKSADPGTLSVTATLDRSLLWEVQTPQIFRREILAQAYAGDAPEATDDAALVERSGYPVRIFPGDDENIKVTTRRDLMLARQLLGEQR